MGCGSLAPILCVLVLATCWQQAFSEDDAQCLKEFKESVQDPQGFLSNWNFSSNATHGYVCSFNGVSCWNGQENKVLGLKLQDAGLSGSFPSGLVLCQALQDLDLSHNQFSGAIPDDLCTQLPYITFIDLSENLFSGPIPVDLENCQYLHSLLLQHNQLSGKLPGGIGILPRLTTLDVSSNLLTGRIPSSYVNRSSAAANPGPPFPASSFDNNPSLCGPPLSNSCPSKSNVGLIVGFVAACTAFLGPCVFILLWVLCKSRPKDDALLRDENMWAKRIKAPESITVLLFDEPVKKLKLSTLMVATKVFVRDSIIYKSATGTVYGAVLADGSMLAVKRLRASCLTEKNFQSEMNTLGCMRHKNLVPLLGYCTAGSEKLLVYKHMTLGSLRSCLHDAPLESKPHWINCLRIGIGAARGLAWLHHSCNPRMIHRNISSESILLDDDHEPRIADYELACLLNHGDTHISADENGVFEDVGYLPPEYPRTRVATGKGDVYSFGVVLLELVTGQNASDVCVKGEFAGNLADWVRFLLSNGRAGEALNSSIGGQCFNDEVAQFLRVACACVVWEPKDRPTMYEVYQMLRSIGQKLKVTDDELAVYSDVINTEETEVPIAEARLQKVV